ncbi:unnamed protein product [Closterium sp. NIES-64]|nr:unnamed protein product [Closterium sp. NIES-64]
MGRDPRDSPRRRVLRELGVRHGVLRGLGYGYWLPVDNQLLDEEGRVVSDGYARYSLFRRAAAARPIRTTWIRSRARGSTWWRLPFSTECLMYNERTPAREAIDFELNPDLKVSWTDVVVVLPSTGRFLMGLLVGRGVQREPDCDSSHRCYSEGVVATVRLRVILANTRIGPARRPSLRTTSGRVVGYAGHSEAVWIGNWLKLAQRYIGERAVVGVSVGWGRSDTTRFHNHPSHPDILWAGDNVGEPYNWRNAAKRAADAIQLVNPHLVIIVQGSWALPPSLPYLTTTAPAADAIQSVNPDLLIIVQGAGHAVHMAGGGPEGGHGTTRSSSRSSTSLAYAVNDFGPFVDPKKPWFKVKYKLAYAVNDFGPFVDPRSPVGQPVPSVENTSTDFQEMQYLEKFQRYIRSRSAGVGVAHVGANEQASGRVLAKSWKKMEQPKMSFLQPIMPSRVRAGQWGAAVDGARS